MRSYCSILCKLFQKELCFRLLGNSQIHITFEQDCKKVAAVLFKTLAPVLTFFVHKL
jgi:hypothetical protein